MDTQRKTASAAIHERLKHPVIDADGHWIEFEPTLLDYLKQVGGPSLVARFRREDYLAGLRSWTQMTPEERGARRPTQPAWWGFPAKNSRDRATAMLPRLLYERLPEIGLDFAVMYPTLALFFATIKDPEVQTGCLPSAQSDGSRPLPWSGRPPHSSRVYPPCTRPRQLSKNSMWLSISWV